MFRLPLLVLALLLSPGVARAAAPEADWWTRLGVTDLAGRPIQPTGRWLVVVFISPECPVANASIPVLNRLAAEFSLKGFDFVGAYADPALEMPILRRHVTESRMGFFVADDRAQRLTRATGATYTPEAFVFSRDGVRLYRGRIDDRFTGFGTARPEASHEDLREVLQALAAGQAGPFEDRPGFGCAIPERVTP